MDWGSILYLGMTIGMFAIFLAIVLRTYKGSRKDHKESPKFRMLDDE